MSLVSIREEYLKEIADAIRDKTGTTQPLTTDVMAPAIASIETVESGTDLTNYYTKLETELILDTYATKEYVDDAVANGGGGSGDADLSDYYTKAETDTAISDAVAAVEHPVKAGAGADSIMTPTAKAASAQESIALGKNANATGAWGVAIGNNANAPGMMSTALGTVAFANKDYSVAIGRNVTATKAEQVVIGKYNDNSDATSNFIIGNGTSNSDRKNAMTVDDDNVAHFPGNVKVGADDAEVATKAYVDEAVANAGGGGDMSAYVTNEYLQNELVPAIAEELNARPTYEWVENKIAEALGGGGGSEESQVLYVWEDEAGITPVDGTITLPDWMPLGEEFNQAPLVFEFSLRATIVESGEVVNEPFEYNATYDHDNGIILVTDSDAVFYPPEIVNENGQATAGEVFSASEYTDVALTRVVIRTGSTGGGDNPEPEDVIFLDWADDAGVTPDNGVITIPGWNPIPDEFGYITLTVEANIRATIVDNNETVEEAGAWEAIYERDGSGMIHLNGAEPIFNPSEINNADGTFTAGDVFNEPSLTDVKLIRLFIRTGAPGGGGGEGDDNGPTLLPDNLTIIQDGDYIRTAIGGYFTEGKEKELRESIVVPSGATVQNDGTYDYIQLSGFNIDNVIPVDPRRFEIDYEVDGEREFRQDDDGLWYEEWSPDPDTGKRRIFLGNIQSHGDWSGEVWIDEDGKFYSYRLPANLIVYQLDFYQGYQSGISPIDSQFIPVDGDTIMNDGVLHLAKQYLPIEDFWHFQDSDYNEFRNQFYELREQVNLLQQKVDDQGNQIAELMRRLESLENNGGGNGDNGDIGVG